MLYIKNYDKNSLAALTYEKERQYYDGLIGKVITIGLICGVMHTGVLVKTFSDGIKLFLLFPSRKYRHPYEKCTYEYIYYKSITSVTTTCFSDSPR